MLAVKHNHASLAAELMSRGAHVNAKAAGPALTALHVAAAYDRRALAKALVHDDAQVNAQDRMV